MDPKTAFRPLFLLLLLCSLSFARGGGGCLLPGTLVSTVNGEKDISAVSVGDRVLSFDGKVISTAQVVAVYSVDSDSYYEIRTDKTSLNVTGEHLVYTTGGDLKQASSLCIGDSVAVYRDGHLMSDRIVSIKLHKENVRAFNLLVDNGNTFLANSILVHNKGCFLPDTPILTSDGRLVNISQVKNGDTLTAFTYDGAILNTTVKDIYRITADGYYVIRTQNYEVRVTAEHPFYIGNGAFKTTDELQVGDVIYVFNGSGLSRDAIVSKEFVEGNITAYNLRTDWPNTYFANFIAVHNKGGGCFTAGTKVTTADGEVNIEAIRSGDTVVAVDAAGRTSYVKVLGTFRTEAQVLQLSTGKRTVYTTAEHPFLTPSGTFRNASELSIGDEVVVFDGGMQYEKITKIEYLDNDVVYNLKVEQPYTYVANGFVVHNKGGGSFGGSSDPYTDATYCGKLEDIKLSNGSTLRGSECIYVYYLRTAGASATNLQNCVVGVYSAWKSCVGDSSFATRRELQFHCETAEPCVGISSINLEDGTTVKVTRPQTLQEMIMELCCAGVAIIVIGGLVVIIKRVAPKSISGDNLDYCYPGSQIDEKAARTAKVLDYLKGIDKEWDADAMKKTAQDTFVKLQQCWEARDYSPMQPLLMPYLYQQHLDQIESLEKNHEIDKIENLEVRRVDIVYIKYYTDKNQQEFTALIEASARDYYVDDRTNEFLRGDSEPAVFQEFWVFHRQDGNWLLREIDQTRESDALRQENFIEDLTPMQLQNIYGDLGGKIGGEKAPWLEDAIGKKDDRVHRLLNFLSPTDKSWNEDFMKESASNVFTAVHTSFEDLDLSGAEKFLMPDAAKFYSDQIEKMKSDNRTVEYRNLCVRKVDLILVKNYNDNDKDEFTARISAHAQKVENQNGKIVSKDEYVSPFEEYWTFQKQNGEWKLREVEPPASTRSIIEEENIDEESSKEQLQWYYTQDRAV